MLLFKEGVDIRGIAPEIVLAMLVTSEVFAAIADVPAVVTCGREGKHSTGSRHYIGHAFDFRTKNILNLSIKQRVVDEIRNRLAPLADFDVFLEDLGQANEHGHVQFKPKGPS